MKYLLAAVVLAIGLAGCATGPQKAPEPEVQVVNKFVPVPVELTEKVALSAPPEPVAYSKLTCDAKEQTLVDLIQKRTEELGVANARLMGIADWSKQQAVIYAPKSNPAAN
jgi:hypothetical protein